MPVVTMPVRLNSCHRKLAYFHLSHMADGSTQILATIQGILFAQMSIIQTARNHFQGYHS